MFQDAKKIHLIGIGGIGVSAVARLLAGLGLEVSGSDVKESSITRALRAEGIPVTIGHDPALVRGNDLVVYSTAVPKDNPEFVEAGRLGIPLAHRSEVLAWLMSGREAVAVLGTHGKGTVASMLTRMLDLAGLDPGFVIGGMLLDYGTNARWGHQKLLVAEVDESDGSHLNVQAEHVVINNLDLDHLNYYEDLDHIVDTLVRFLDQDAKLRHLVVNVDSEGTRRLLERTSRPVITVSTTGRADVTCSGVRMGPMGSRFTVHRTWAPDMEVTLGLPGEHNVENALAALAMAGQLGVPDEAALRALESTRGLENRFTVVRARGVTLVKDYLSHPNGMRKVLRAARRLAEGRLVAVYKPYRYTLLKYLGDEYADAFSLADLVILTDMYTAGEEPIPGIGDDYLVRKCRQRGIEVIHVHDTEDVPPALTDQIGPGDVVTMFGGDDFFRMADRFAAELEGGEA